MSRSRKKHPAGGISTAESGKLGKQRANRTERHAVRIALHGDPERELLPDKHEITNPATFPKDGKQWFGGVGPQLVRK